MHGIHHTSKVENKYLDVHERVEMVQRNKDGPLSSPALQWIVRICKRKSHENIELVKREPQVKFIRMMKISFTSGKIVPSVLRPQWPPKTCFEIKNKKYFIAVADFISLLVRSL